MTFAQGNLPLEPAAPPPADTVEAKGMTITAPKSVDPLLVRILSWKRPHGTVGEIAFMSWLHAQITGMGVDFKIMAEGCVAVSVPRPDGKVTATLFSCHTDTVHYMDGPLQKIAYDPEFGHIFLDKDDPDAGSCLGADDGAGVWLMLKMIENKKPGTYLFHRGEERGGIGSRAMLAKHKEWLEQFDIAVAFDRPNTYEVITHQGGQECCSDKFAKALCAALSTDALAYSPSNRGVFTDTKVYRGVIPECTNIGVGYFDQHGKDETLDYAHLVDLLDVVLDIDWDALPVDRDPAKANVYQYSGATQYPRYQQARAPFGTVGLGNVIDTGGTDDHDDSTAPPISTDLTTLEELDQMTADDMWNLCHDDPDSAYRVIVDLYTDIKAMQTRVDTLRTLLGI